MAAKHGTGHGKRHPPAPPVKVTRRPSRKPPPTVVPPTPKPSSSSTKLRDAAQELLAALLRMPHARDHAPGCPSATSGPCTCGAEQLAAAITTLGDALEP